MHIMQRHTKRSTSVATLVAAAVVAGPVVAASAATIAAVAAQADDETGGGLSVEEPSGHSSWTPVSAHATAPGTEVQADFAAKGRSNDEATRGDSRLLDVEVTAPQGDYFRFKAGDDSETLRTWSETQVNTPIGPVGETGYLVSVGCNADAAWCELDEGPDAFLGTTAGTTIAGIEETASDPGAYVDMFVEAIERVDQDYVTAEAERLADLTVALCQDLLEEFGADAVCTPPAGDEG